MSDLKPGPCPPTGEDPTVAAFRKWTAHNYAPGSLTDDSHVRELFEAFRAGQRLQPRFEIMVDVLAWLEDRIAHDRQLLAITDRAGQVELRIGDVEIRAVSLTDAIAQLYESRKVGEE